MSLGFKRLILIAREIAARLPKVKTMFAFDVREFYFGRRKDRDFTEPNRREYRLVFAQGTILVTASGLNIKH